MDEKLKKQHVIATLTDSLEFWTVKKLKTEERNILELSENLNLIEILKQTSRPSSKLCATLRYNAMQSARFSPVIAAHLDLLADQLDPRKITLH